MVHFFKELLKDCFMAVDLPILINEHHPKQDMLIKLIFSKQKSCEEVVAIYSPMLE